MTTKADLAARATRATQRRVSGMSEKPVTAPAPIPRAKPIRITADFAPQVYRSLTRFCDQLAIALGRPRVPQVEVLRALLAELDDDDDLQTRIQERIANTLNN